MRKFKENLDYLQLLLENKDHLIDRLSLTDEQKEELKSFFKAHPNYENKIDWNKKDLTYKDFEFLLTNAGKSRNQAKKTGIAGLKEGTDYLIIGQGEATPEFDYVMYRPLTHLASKTIASPVVSPKLTGQWCISMNSDTWWRDYVGSGNDFFFICITGKEDPQAGYKFALSRKASEYFLRLGSSVLPEGTDIKDLEETYTIADLKPLPEDFSDRLPLKSKVLLLLDEAVDIFNAADQGFSLWDLAKEPRRLIDLNLIDRPACTALTRILDKYLGTIATMENTLLKGILEKKDLLLTQIFTPTGRFNQPVIEDLSHIEYARQFFFDLNFPASYPERFFPAEDSYEETLFDGSWEPDYEGMPGDEITNLWLGGINIMDMSRTKVHTILPQALANLPIKQFIPPASLKLISEDGFCGCSHLTELDFSELKSLYVEKGAFSYIYCLKSIKFPKDLTLENSVFKMDTGLEDISYAGTLRQFLACLPEDEGPYDESDPLKTITALFSGAYRMIKVRIHCTDKDLDLDGGKIWQNSNPETRLNLLKKQSEKPVDEEEEIPF